MKVRIQGMLATAAGAALFASAGIALADGMPGGGSYARPALWSGAYVGFESGWDWDHANTDLFAPPKASWNRDVVNAGLFGGYQHQFGAIVVGAEFSLIGNEFDDNKSVTPVVGNGNCFGGLTNCATRVTDVFTLGPRLGVAVGNFMPYATGGWATGSINTRSPCPIGATCTVGGQPVAVGADLAWADGRAYGWYAGGGLDWKLARNVVVGIEYRHVDLGSVDAPVITPFGASGGTTHMRAEEDTVLLRGSLLFGARDYAPLK